MAVVVGLAVARVVIPYYEVAGVWGASAIGRCRDWEVTDFVNSVGLLLSLALFHCLRKCRDQRLVYLALLTHAVWHFSVVPLLQKDYLRTLPLKRVTFELFPRLPLSLSLPGWLAVL